MNSCCSYVVFDLLINKNSKSHAPFIGITLAQAMMTRRDWRRPPTLPKGGSLIERVQVEDPAPSKRGLRWRPNGHRPYFQELRIRQQTAPSVPEPPLTSHSESTHPPIQSPEERGGGRRERKYRRRLIRSARERRGDLRRLRDLSMPVFWYVELTLGVHLYLQDVDGACALAEEHME